MLNRRPCCFDAGLTTPLLRHFLSRLKTMSLDDFLETKLARFLEALLIRIVVTSTPVEMAFAKMTALTSACHQQRIGRQSLSSKRCIYGYDKQVTRWRQGGCSLIVMLVACTSRVRWGVSVCAKPPRRSGRGRGAGAERGPRPAFASLGASGRDRPR